MKGDPQVIGYLNRVLVHELSSINQYFLHARMHKNWGLHKLNDCVYRASIRAMKQADGLIERILFLESLPNVQEINYLHIGEHTEEMLRCDLKLETAGLALLREAIAHCELASDYISRELLEHILEDAEEHLDWLETQLELIGKVRLDNYLQSAMGISAS